MPAKVATPVLALTLTFGDIVGKSDLGGFKGKYHQIDICLYVFYD
jgi:hypothetical protein